MPKIPSMNDVQNLLYSLPESDINYDTLSYLASYYEKNIEVRWDDSRIVTSDFDILAEYSYNQESDEYFVSYYEVGVNAGDLPLKTECFKDKELAIKSMNDWVAIYGFHPSIRLNEFEIRFLDAAGAAARKEVIMHLEAGRDTCHSANGKMGYYSSKEYHKLKDNILDQMQLTLTKEQDK
jgi:hypothetical protein